MRTARTIPAGAAALAVLMDAAEKKIGPYPDIMAFPAWKLFEYERAGGEPLPDWWGDETARKYRYLEYVAAALAKVEAEPTMLINGGAR